MKRLVLNIRNEWVVIFILILCSLPSAIAFIHPGFPQTDDGNWMIIRLSAFYESMRAGEFPVRWLSRLNNGYGYPVSNFLYPGFMYLGVPIAVLTSSFVMTTKLLFTMSLVLSSVGMYLWLRRSFNKWPSIVGGLIYLYSPYHLFDVTVRGSLGEVLVLALAPFVFWALDRKSVGLTGIFLGLLLISHNTLAVLFLPVIIFYQLLRSSVGMSLVQRWAGIILGITLSAFFWIPAIVELKDTVFAQVAVSNWAEYFADFHLIGLVQIVVLLTGALIFFTKYRQSFQEKKPVIFFIIIAGASLFMSAVISTPIWQLLPVQFIQFPFRILSLAIFATAFLSAWIMNSLQRKVICGCFFLIVAAMSTLPYLLPRGYDYFDEGYYATNQATTTVKNEYMPKWVKETATSPTRIVTARSAIITNEVRSGSTINFTTTAEKSEKIFINQIYFPGWRVQTNNKDVPMRYDNPKGIMEVTVNKGRQTVMASFEETPLRLLADFISVFSLVILLGFLLKNIKKR